MTVEALALLIFTADRSGLGDNATRLFREMSAAERQPYLARAVQMLTHQAAA